MTSPSGNYVGQAPAATGLGDVNGILFAIRQVLGKTGTAMVVEVMAVENEGELAPVGFVDIKPMVAQIDGAGNATPHGTIYNVPYFRLQGGTNAVIIDPVVGDIGLAVVSSRDISAVKATKKAALPGSRRRFDLADSVYFGGILNGVPEQYLRFSAEGVEIVSPTKVTLRAPAIELDGPVTGTATAVFTDDVTGAGISLSTHTHDGVEPGAGNTGPPQ